MWKYKCISIIIQYLDVCVATNDHQTNAPVLTGQNILNTVTAQATNLTLISATHSKLVDPTQPKVIATKYSLVLVIIHARFKMQVISARRYCKI